MSVEGPSSPKDCSLGLPQIRICGSPEEAVPQGQSAQEPMEVPRQIACPALIALQPSDYTLAMFVLRVL
jgi:hypothetical protein